MVGLLNSDSEESQDSTYGRAWPPRLYLAIDCGGTKAAAVICDETGSLVGRGQGGPSNYTDNGLVPFLSNVEDAVRAALEHTRHHYRKVHFTWQAGDESCAECPSTTHNTSTQTRPSVAEAFLSMKPSYLPEDAPVPSFEAAWLGIAGVDSPADVATLTPHIGKLLAIAHPGPRLIVANDTSLLASPIADSTRPEIKSGVVVIAGTGSICMSFRRRQNGMLKVLGRVGGFGWLLGDEGSGYAVGRNAVRKVLDLADRERLALRKADDDSDVDSEDEEVTSATSDNKVLTRKGDNYDMDVAVRLSSEFRSDSNESMPTSGATSPSSEASAVVKDSSRPHGHLLRDRILQHWNLMSTDELLRAVYFDDTSLGNSVGQPADQTSFNDLADAEGGNLSRSDLTLRGRHAKAQLTAREAAMPSIILPKSEASANLLPPTGPTLDAETRLRGTSPIPSLSSSPSMSTVPSSNDSSAQPSPTFQPAHRPPVDHRSHSDSAIHTELTSAASSFSTQQSHPRGTAERKHRLASLAPLVFHLAFAHEDTMSLDIIRCQAHSIALQVQDILQADNGSKAYVNAVNSVLCLGGSLVGVQRYREILVEELSRLGIMFARVEFVGDAARRGAVALSHVMEKQRSQH